MGGMGDIWSFYSFLYDLRYFCLNFIKGKFESIASKVVEVKTEEPKLNKVEVKEEEVKLEEVNTIEVK